MKVVKESTQISSNTANKSRKVPDSTIMDVDTDLVVEATPVNPSGSDPVSQPNDQATEQVGQED